MDDSTSSKAGTAATWAVASTQPNRHAVALENLARQAFEVYCPVMRKRVRHARRTQEVLRPLFPGYIFVGINPADGRWRAVNSTAGVRSLVRFGSQISYIDAGLIGSLKAREVNGVISMPASPFKIGQNVRLFDGPFEGLVAKIIAVDEKARLTLLMEFLSQSVRIQIDGRQVVPL